LYVDWFRQVFLNLLLNSADAFEAQSRRRGREIRLQVKESGGAREPKLSLRYTDNAGGIQPQLLTFPHLYNENREPEYAIFQQDVTSKKDGSGWGMYLVRKILEDHAGSISLVARRGGVTFDIEIPMQQGG
jgi:signal transduction histidine kinase